MVDAISVPSFCAKNVTGADCARPLPVERNGRHGPTTPASAGVEDGRSPARGADRADLGLSEMCNGELALDDLGSRAARAVARPAERLALATP